MRLIATTDLSGAVDKLRMIGTEVADKAVVRALNKVAASTSTQAVRQIRDDGYNILARDLRVAFRVKRASKGSQVAELVATGKPISLIKFGAKENGRTGNVSVRIKGKITTLHNAFIAQSPDPRSKGGKEVFVRIGTGHIRSKIHNGRLQGGPVRVLFGPSIPGIFRTKSLQDQLIAYVRQRFPVVLQQEINFANLKRAA